MAKRFAGNYTVAVDSGLFDDEVATTNTAADAGPQSYALLQVARALAGGGQTDGVDVPLEPR